MEETLILAFIWKNITLFLYFFIVHQRKERIVLYGLLNSEAQFKSFQERKTY